MKHRGKPQGKVYLVGAGPGDPGLITKRGLDLLQRADVVFYDHLADKGLLSSLKPGAGCVYVGKRGAEHALEQGEINSLIVEEAKKGRMVVRLKGGDPFVFGRGGEEAIELAQAEVPFEIVPGVTSAIAAPAYAGIPVTHRDFTSTVTFVTGHERSLTPGPSPAEGRGESDSLPWDALAKLGTVVFLMGVGNLPRIVERLTGAGRNPETPVAVIEWGTYPFQKTAVSTLKHIVKEVEAMGIHPPAVTVVGDVVKLREELNWFEKRKLFGKRILVTRTREQASELTKRLEEEGALVHEIPTIELKPPSSWRALDRSIGGLRKYDWVVFTSVNGVSSFFARLWKLGGDLRQLAGIQIAAIGPATARAIEDRGVRVDLVAKEFRAEGVIAALKRKKIRGKRILIPRAKEAREVLVDQLKKLGARVDLVEAYRMVVPKAWRQQLAGLIQSGEIDLITFASSSTVENFMKMVDQNLGGKVRAIPVASIGPITSGTIKKHGLNLKIQPKQYTIPTMVEEILGYYQR